MSIYDSAEVQVGPANNVMLKSEVTWLDHN